MDIHTRQGKYASSVTYPARLPCTLGMEGAGVVVEVGLGVSHLAVGDRVAWCIAWGAYAEYANVPAGKIAQIPNAISFDQAAAAMFQGCTAHDLMDDVARLHAGSTCLIHAASGSIGQLLVQMARHVGLTVFDPTTVGRPHGRWGDRATACQCGIRSDA
ncbi:quinone oxidoreductase 1 [Pseudomonas antarctica]|uniref:Quinone oxidoreductase 1 n=1 Tax=Pseudomonas antarctica TaxID=219572 RepID=A0ABQ6ZQ81_9PSED|nr:quinone oxidoreductase 1 [Pseudomonas antarctica]